jgi:hypothetical protein
MSDYSDVITVAAFAKEIGSSAQTVGNWVEKAGIKPIHSIDKLRLFSKAALAEGAEKYGRSRAGYVHPDKFKELQDLHANAVLRQIELEKENEYLLANFNTLQAEYNAVMDKADENMDKAERMMNQLVTGESLTDAEYDEKYPVESEGFVVSADYAAALTDINSTLGLEDVHVSE